VWWRPFAASAILPRPARADSDRNGVTAWIGQLVLGAGHCRRARAVQRSCATATESDVQHALREATVLLRGGILKGGNL